MDANILYFMNVNFDSCLLMDIIKFNDKIRKFPTSIIQHHFHMSLSNYVLLTRIQRLY